MSSPPQPTIHTIFEPTTGTWQYIIACPLTHHAAIIDSVLDYMPSTQTVSSTTADSLLSLIQANNYTIDYILETHAHADHLTASYYLKQRLLSLGQDPKIGIGKRITTVQSTFAKKLSIPQAELENVFDHLWTDYEEFQIGDLKAEVLHLPGHTPDHVGYKIGESVFTGDSIFNPDVGSARCDFPGGDAHALWTSMSNLLSLPECYRLYTGHDYPPTDREGSGEGGKEKPYTTVKEQKQFNKHVKEGTQKEDFVNWRKERDGGLGEPRLMGVALQVNVRGGRLPRDGVMVGVGRVRGEGDFLGILGVM
ncbi:related to Zn-dependent hydrolases, including glyoxylases [Phialocephala subalpina]|uniref:Related to Zn-dependent hydrolases, including glyoxylases n=1 Tax=Phialocephala subalpina TaxID=576137 RepID=A0A1L7XE86_9HELO|nr:related to Zn-dependent hydrolases, including glyoxylases [Phialocephala subalpina]